MAGDSSLSEFVSRAVCRSTGEPLNKMLPLYLLARFHRFKKGKGNPILMVMRQNYIARSWEMRD